MFHRTIVKYTNISLLSDSFTIFDVQQGMIIRYHSISFTSISNSSSLPQMQQQQLTPTRIQFTCPFCIFSFFFSHQLTGWPLRKSHLLFSAGHHIHNLCHNVRISLSLSPWPSSSQSCSTKDRVNIPVCPTKQLYYDESILHLLVESSSNALHFCL